MSGAPGFLTRLLRPGRGERGGGAMRLVFWSTIGGAIGDPEGSSLRRAGNGELAAQSSAGAINTAHDLWAAQILKYGEDIPWKNAAELYSTIDSIQHGDTPWKVYKIRYQGQLPAGTPPKWMTQTYELCTRDVHAVLHTQLATTDFKGQLNYTPYRQFNGKGRRDDIAQDPSMHGCMLIPLGAGSDKTTISVATGHQEYHPVYVTPGNITNIVRRAQSLKRQCKTVAYQRFVRQMYHACLALIFEPLKAGMTTPEVVRCPDGHFRRAVYTLGPYIADYSEQNWCPKSDAPAKDLDLPGARIRTQAKTYLLITTFDPEILWDDLGIHHDVVPYTHGFPQAEIYELLSPDLLHQFIKGTFKDHLVEWVMEYLHDKHGQTRALEIIADIDHRISAVSSFPGLRRFPDGQDFQQWTGDDSKALMKVYLAEIAGHVPPAMLRCMSAFLDFCYLVRRNAISADTLDEIQDALNRFHTYHDIFIATGVRVTISLPRQHSMVHYIPSIILFGSPNGLCSSITESKHIKAVKEPWRRSNRHNALIQMLRTLTRLDRLAAIQSIFTSQGIMQGSTSLYTAQTLRGEAPEALEPAKDDDDDDDSGDSPGPKSLSSVELARTPQRAFPKNITDLAAHIQQPLLPELVRRFLYEQLNPESNISSSAVPLDSCPRFDGRVRVFLSAVTRFYAPSDLCGAGGMYRERIRANPKWHGKYPRYDTVFVVTDPDLPGMHGMEIGRVFLFFSFIHSDTHYPCALVQWYRRSRQDDDTGMWVVTPEVERNCHPTLAVLHLDCIARAAHLLPVYGSELLPDDFHFSYSLDSFRAFFVNRYTDHHTHEFLSE
ncbi:hypothetical protein B0H14DRAFT_3090933 [Mycena olivaceomarginata]|nr:hypothetical protein B0H14DRAFT_3090933 [Mycena olivaceomarginata]